MCVCVCVQIALVNTLLWRVALYVFKVRRRDCIENIDWIRFCCVYYGADIRYLANYRISSDDKMRMRTTVQPRLIDITKL